MLLLVITQAYKLAFTSQQAFVEFAPRVKIKKVDHCGYFPIENTRIDRKGCFAFIVFEVW